MDSVDTNVLVRWLLGDDEGQSVRARGLLRGAPLFVSDVVLCEVVWVLRSLKVPRSQLIGIVDGLVEGSEFVYQDRDRLRRATAAFRSGKADFSDYVILEQAREKAGQLYTFDVALQAEGGVRPP